MKHQYSAGENLTISVAKGLCILLVVIGHAESPEFIFRFIYLFHVPLFFFTSGYFNKVAEDGTALKVRLWRRVKNLYLPFILYGLVFLLLDPLLVKVGWVADSGRSLFSRGLLMLLKMDPPSDLLGGFWFIRSLFIASVAADIMLFVTKKHIPVWLLLLLSVVVALIMKSFPPGTPVVRQLSLAVLGIVFFLSGMIYRTTLEEKLARFSSWARYGILLEFGLLLAVSILYPRGLSVSSAGVLDTLVFIVCAMIGIHLVMGISKYLAGTIFLKPFRLFGNVTLEILALHFLCFKVVSWLAVSLYGLSWSLMSGPAAIPGLPGAWWLLYTCVGMGLPILFALAKDAVVSFKPEK